MFIFNLFTTFGAECVDLEAMAHCFPAELPANPVSQGDQLVIRELHMLAGLHAHDVVSRLLAVDKLVVGLLGVEKGLRDDACVLQELDGPVERSFGDAVAVLPHFEHQFFNFKDAVSLNDGVKDVSPFRGVLEILGFEKTPEHRTERSHGGER